MLLSHLHPDHYFDISGLYVVWKYHPSGPQERIPVYGPAGVARQAARAYGLPKEPGMSAEFDFREYDDAPIHLGPFVIRSSRVVHPVPAYGLRLTAFGRTLAYSGDTGRTDALLELAADADLFLCEASFREGDDNPPSLHLTGKEAGEYATRAGAKRLIVTHVPPRSGSGRSCGQATPSPEMSSVSAA